MPRQKRLRKVHQPPGFKGYKPYGNLRSDRNHIDLMYEEYEAIKLADYDLMNHLEAAKIMGVSRPTFARIYEGARRKIAKALVETRQIKSVCGHATFDKFWYICENCHARFSIPDKADRENCPICKSNKIHSLISQQ